MVQRFEASGWGCGKERMLKDVARGEFGVK
jgi:hypothetical protein